MSRAQCPKCRCEEFYFKNPEDNFEVFAFTLEDGTIRYDAAVDNAGMPEIEDRCEVYCNRCSWHDTLEVLK
ncbi:MAG TPA: hypothetical protein VLL97_09085 [Acidobacteriota bacterium]|nr:hypothetical protein [Acidobacteriota bacterium]